MVVLEIDYNWVRGTRDDGGRISTTQIRINNRKLPSPMAVISYVSNVNHWLLSHDNVWAALPQDHPALREQKAKKEAEQRHSEGESITGSNHGSNHSAKPDPLQPSSTPEDDIVRSFFSTVIFFPPLSREPCWRCRDIIVTVFFLIAGVHVFHLVGMQWFGFATWKELCNFSRPVCTDPKHSSQ